MGPTSYMRSVVGRNVVMRRIPVVCGNAVANPSFHTHLRGFLLRFGSCDVVLRLGMLLVNAYSSSVWQGLYCHLDGKWQHLNMTDEECGTRRLAYPVYKM